MLHLLLQQTFGSDAQVEACQVVNDQQDYWACQPVTQPSVKVSNWLVQRTVPYSFDRMAVLLCPKPAHHYPDA
jgi:hypothetical protein